MKKKQKTISQTTSNFFNEIFKTSSPGTIIKDAEKFLNYVKENKVKLSIEQKVLQEKTVEELNNLMTFPLHFNKDILFEQSNYPNIDGLFNLLTAACFFRYSIEESDFYLEINKNIFEQWQEMTEAEKYINLFGVYLFEYPYQNIDDNFQTSSEEFVNLNILNFMASHLKEMPAQLQGDEAKKNLDWIPNTFIELMRMFGCIQINEKVNSNKWCIEEVSRSSIGKVFFPLIHRFIENIDFKVILKNKQENLLITKWIIFFNNIYSEINKPLLMIREKPEDGVYIFKIKFRKIWRRFAVPSFKNLDDLCKEILDSLNFPINNFYELNATSLHGKTSSYIYEEENEAIDNPVNIPISSMSKYLNIPMELSYNYGDICEIDILIEAIENPIVFDEIYLLEKEGELPVTFLEEMNF